MYCTCIRTYFFFFTLIKEIICYKNCLLDYFIFRYCFLTHVAVHISLLLSKL